MPRYIGVRQRRTRRFQGNQHTRQVSDNRGSDVSDVTADPPSASKRKLHDSIAHHSHSSAFKRPKQHENEHLDKLEGSVVFDLSILAELVNKYCRCPDCGAAPIGCGMDGQARRGYAVCLALYCDQCAHHETVYTSRKCEKEGKGDRAFVVNRLSTMAYRFEGLGHRGMVNMAGILDMPGCLSRSSYKENLSTLVNETTKEAERSMNKASEAVHSQAEVGQLLLFDFSTTLIT